MLTSDNSGICKNVTILGADMGSSVHVDNKKNCILILGRSPANGLDNTTLTSEAEYIINFSEQNKFCLSLHYNGSKSFLFVDAVKLINSKQNILN